ncbi:tyrosine-type recombinase/integrase [Acrocarpospora sp. B8E8]|uniref:tyrosine-type recombinase/integrase n=1 Tax=Acrocarpospora sp. B8E8 TaxID=3153572 RepID=UPI00325E98C7
MSDTTFRVRIYKTEKRKNVKGVITSYRVLWKVGDEIWKESFSKAALADAFRSKLVTAASEGEAFSVSSGRPVSWHREESSVSWYAFTLSYADVKWPYASPNHRRGIAETLTDATEALMTSEKDAPPREVRRAALRWSYSTRIRDQKEPPPELRETIRWLEQHTTPLLALCEPGKGATLTRALLDRVSRIKTGELAAANTANRKRAILNNAMEYAREISALPANPLKSVKWTKPRKLASVDPRTVINIEQARRFFTTVRKNGKRGERMEAFFACMYFAALRPEEVIDLRKEHLVSLPDDGWGEMRLTNAEPRAGSRWTNSGKPRERRALKHRADGETRPVPIHPDLVSLLRGHLKEFGTGPEGRVFVGPRGGQMTDRAYLKVFHEARAEAFTPEEASSPLMDVPYALRHAAVSTWLNAGVPAPQVAAWAGHSVDVLLRVYAKCIYGQEADAMRRIWDATRP